MTGIRLEAGAASDVGRVRPINQDSYLVLADHDLYVVADGMGGHQGGEVASKLAVDTLRTAYADTSSRGLTEAILDANGRIFDAGEGDPSLRGMGTTVVAAALVPRDGTSPDGDTQDELLIANVGDSRAYLFRQGALTQLTEDHSMVADLLREGRITAEEAEVHPQRNIVTRVLGVYEEVEIDLWPVDPVRGDRYLLCSDGLFNEVGTDAISAALRRLRDPQEAASELVRLANDGGGRDNITVLVLDVVDDGGLAEAASAALADAPRTVRSGSDLAGFGTALDDAGLRAPGRGEIAEEVAEEERPPRRSLRDRFTWRAIVFPLVVLGVIVGAVVTIQWYGTSTYFVRFGEDGNGNRVEVFKGRPDGLLWIDPELIDETGIPRARVPARYVQDLETGHELSTQSKADDYVELIEDDIQATSTTTTTTTIPTSTTVPATTSTAPPG